jgi:flagellar biosynthesis protein FlhF
MEIKTYRAATLQEALQLVRQELGPDAAVLRAREVAGSLWQRLRGQWQIEVTAATDVAVPPRLPQETVAAPAFHGPAANPATARPRAARAEAAVPEAAVPEATRFGKSPPGRRWPLLDELARRPAPGPRLPASVFDLFVDLLDAELGDELARELIEEARGSAGEPSRDDASLLKSRLLNAVEGRIAATGPIVCEPGRRRIAALVGPTGVGKTTTLAKLAANFRLREGRRVGLVTVDTYRIAAVEQLRTYAEIIDLPMEVVATPGDMRRALARLADVDLVLLDTAGRSPRDELRIQELKSILAEARADEVHLVLSAASGVGPLRLAVERFAAAGVTSVLLTKLDEAATLGPAFALLQRSGRRLSYLTHGQNVPDDIEVADARRFARRLLSKNMAVAAATRAGEVSQA